MHRLQTRFLLPFSAALLAASCTPNTGSNSQAALSFDTHIAVTSELEQDALNVVERKTSAYNAHNMAEFLATYHPEVRIYEYPDMLLGEGRSHLEMIFGAQFEENEGEITVHSRHALGNRVVSDETSTTWDNAEHIIGIYTVENGLIVEVRLIEPRFQ